MRSDDPDDSVPVHPSVSKATSHEVKGMPQEEEKRVPLYLSTTASMRAKMLPTKQFVKRESRLPPRMVLRKRTMSSSEASDMEKKISSGPGKSISSSPERVSSEALRQKEEERVKEEKKATPVISRCIIHFSRNRGFNMRRNQKGVDEAADEGYHLRCKSTWRRCVGIV